MAVQIRNVSNGLRTRWGLLVGLAAFGLVWGLDWAWLAQAQSAAPAQSASSASAKASPTDAKSPAAKPAQAKPTADQTATDPAKSASASTASSGPAKETPSTANPPAAQSAGAGQSVNKASSTTPAKAAQSSTASKPAGQATSTPSRAASASKQAAAKKTAEQPKKLRFNFRYQRWVDVLEWFAQQAGLSLVLDAPPPGTFNYTDDREYTPEEAIDLLNSILLPKGFTLIRRERMLQVVDLRKGYPEGLIPRVSLDELDKHGKFELVSVLFPLEGRDAEAVAKEITPLLGPYGRCTPLPQTKQVLVTDRAGIMKTIAEVIRSMPVPPKPSTPPPQPKPEKPELEIYEVKNVDPQTVVEIARLLVPDVRMIIDPKTQQIYAYGGPSRQAVVKKVLEQMEASNPPDQRPRLQVYSVGQLTSREGRDLVGMLELAVPEARLRYDADTGALVVWATPKEHEIVQATLKQMGRGGGPVGEGERKLQLHRLAGLDPDTTLELLRNVVPTARFFLDEQSKSVVVVGSDSDQKAVASVLEQLRTSRAGEGGAKLQVYSLNVPLPEDAQSLFERIVPQADVTIDQEGLRLIAYATPADHEKLRSLLDEIEKAAAGGEPPKLVVYRVPPSQIDQVKWLLDSLIGVSTEQATSTTRRVTISPSKLARLTPAQIARLRARGLLPPEGKQPEAGVAVPELHGVRVIADRDRGELAVWARPSQHKFIADIISELTGGGEKYEEAQLQAYPVAGVDHESLLEVLQSAHPDARIVYDEQSQRVLVWAPASTQAAIKKSLETIQGGPQEAGQRELQVYSINFPIPDGFSDFLAKLVPQAQITIDTATQRILALASKSDHEKLQKALDQMKTAGKPEQVFVIYHVQPSQMDRIKSILQELIKESTRSLAGVGSRYSPSRLARMTPAQINRLRSMGFLPSSEQGKAVDMTGVRIVSENERGDLVILATPEQHKVIAALIDELEGKAGGAGEQELVAYSVRHADLQSVLKMLETLYPEAQFVADSENRRILAWAPKQTQSSIAKSLQEMQVDKPGENQPRFASYPLYGAPADSLIRDLQKLVPEAQITVDRTGSKLIAWGTPEVHEKLKAALDQLQQGNSPETTPQLEVYQLTKVDPTAAQRLLETLVPNARITIDSKSRRLIALAVPADQQVIRSTLDQLQSTQLGDHTPQVRFYPITKALPSNITSLLTKLVPDAQITLDQANKQLVVVATADDHQIIQKTLQEMEKALPPAEEPQLMVYPMTPTQRKRFDAILKTISDELPGIKVIDDGEAGAVSIWAKPSQHKVLAEIIQQLKTEVPESDQYQLVAYPLKSADPNSVKEILESVFPNTKIVVDEQSGRLLIWTTPADHARIKAAIEQLDSGKPVDRAEGFQLYPVRDTDPQLALQILQQILPKVKFVYDSRSGNIIAWARPQQREIIEKALQRLEAEPDEEHRPLAEVYPLGAMSGSTVTEFLRSIAPNARISVDEDAGTVMVWATPKEHQLIGEAMQKMQAQAGGESGRKMVIYNLPNTGAATAYTLLRRAFPRMTFTYSSADRTRLIAWGPARDHKLLEQVVEQLEDTSSLREGRELHVYDASVLGASPTITLLRNALPSVRLTAGSDGASLIAWVKPDEHQLIEQVLSQLKQEAATKDQRQLKSYTLTNTDTYSAQTVLNRMFPTVRIIAPRRSSTLLVWATAEQHKKIAEMIQQLDAGPDEQHRPRLETYPLGSLTSSSVLTFLRQAVPKATFSIDENSGNLLAWATPQDHKTIRETIQKMLQTAEAAGPAQVMIYDMPATGANRAYYVLRQAFPRMRITYSSTDTTKLLAWGPAEDQKKLAELVEKLEEASMREANRELRAYDVKSIGASRAQVILAKVAPRATFSIGTDRNTLIVWASPEDHALIEKVVQQLPPATEVTTQAFRLEHADPSAVYRSLLYLVPQARVALDTPNRRVIVTALPDDMKKVEAAIAELDREDAEHEPKLVVYQVGEADPSAVSSFLRTVVPSARVTVDAKTGSLMVYATPSEHATIKATIDEMLKQTEAAGSKFEVYDVRSTGAGVAYYLLRSAFPRMQFSYSPRDPSRLVAWGSAADHEKLKQVIEKLESSASRVAGYELRSYDVESVGSRRAQTILSAILPQAIFAPGPDPDTVMAWATPEDHQVIEQIVSQLPPVPEVESKVYRLEHANVYSVYMALRSLVPQATVAMDTANRSVIVTALPKDQEKVAAAVKEMDQQDAEHEPKLVVYSTGEADPNAVATFLRSAMPTVRVTADRETGKLMVWATPAEHTTVKATIDELVAQTSEGGAKVVSYEVPHTGARTAYYFLRYAFPRMQFSYSVRDDTRIIAYGTAKDHEKLSALIQQLEEQAAEQAGYVVKTYDVESVGASQATRMIEKLAPKATVTTGPDPKTVLVWASPDDHKRIEEFIGQLPPLPEKISKVYYVQHADPSAAIDVLESLAPDATFSLDRENRKIIVSAFPKDHERIKAAIEQMDREDPNAPKPFIKIHPFRRADPLDVYYAVRNMYRLRRDVYMSLDRENESLVVVGPPDVHEQIDKLIADLEAAGEELHRGMTIKSYDVKSLDAREVRAILRQAVPKAEVTIGEDPDKLIVRAKPEDHQLVEKILKEIPPKPEMVSRTYYFKRTDPNAALPVLEALAPQAELSVDDENRAIIASATEEDHAKLKKAIDEMEEERADAPVPKIGIHPFKTADPYDVYRALQAMYQNRPDVSLSLDTGNDTIIAVAPPEVHEKIDELIKEVEQAGASMRQGMTVKTYDVGSVGARDARNLIHRAVPKAELTVGEDPNKLIVRARPEDHVLIEQILNELPPASKKVTRVYYFRKVDPRAVSETLQAVAPEAEISVDRDNKAIVVSATEEDQAKLRDALAELEKDEQNAPEAQVKTYLVRQADPYSVYLVLRTMYRDNRDVQVAFDRIHDTLIVVAPDDEQRKIAELVQTVEAAGQAEGAEKLQFYSIKNMDPNVVLQVVQDLLRRENRYGSAARVSVAPQSQQLVVVARPEIHDLVREALDGLKTEEPVLEVYQLEMIDPLTAQTAILNLLGTADVQPPPVVDYDLTTQRLFVRATKEQQEKIRDLLVKMGEEGLAVRTQTGALGGGRMRVIPFDGDTAQAVKQILEIWPQLRKNPIRVIQPGQPFQSTLGEPTGGQSSDKGTGSEQGNGSSRTSDTSSQSSSTSQGATSSAGASGKPAESKASKASQDKPASGKQPEQPSRSEPPKKTNSAGTQASVGPHADVCRTPARAELHKARASSHDTAAAPDTRRPTFRLVGLTEPVEQTEGTEHTQTRADRSGGEATSNPGRSSAAPNPPATGQPQPTQSKQPTQSQQKQPAPQKEAPPIVVIVGPDSVTVTSDDPEALNQFESLLRSLSGRVGVVGRNLMIVPLHNVTAATVALTLNRLFRSDRYGTVATGPVTVVPEERLNAVIVSANRADRAMIRTLIQILDTAEIPDSQAIKKTILIPVKNTDAYRILAVLRNIYHTQLTTRPLAQPLPLPSRVPSRLAAAIQQMNALAAGPLLTIDVEEQSNSLIVMGPTPLLEEIKELVAELDRVAKEERDKEIRVITLKKTNTERVQQALDFLRGYRSSRYRSYSSSGRRYPTRRSSSRR